MAKKKRNRRPLRQGRKIKTPGSNLADKSDPTASPKVLVAEPVRANTILPSALPRSPQRSLLAPAVFLFLVSAPAVYSLQMASRDWSLWVLLAYLFLVWALGIAMAFFGRRGLRANSKSGWSSRV